MLCHGSREVLLVNFRATPKFLCRDEGFFSLVLGLSGNSKLNSLFLINQLLSPAFNFGTRRLGHMPTSKHSGSTLQKNSFCCSFLCICGRFFQALLPFTEMSAPGVYSFQGTIQQPIPEVIQREAY